MVNNYQKDEEKTKFSFSNLKRILKFFKPYKKGLTLSFFLGIFSNLLLLIIPQIFLYAIDKSFPNQNFMEIILLTFIILGLVLLSVFIAKLKRDKLLMVLDNVSHDLKVAIFTKLQYLPNNYFDTHSHGKIYTRATNYPDEVSAILCYVLLDSIIDIINLLFVIIFMLATNIKLSLIPIILALIVTTILLLLSPLRRRLKNKANDKNANVNAYLSESMGGIRITQSFNRELKNENILKDLEEKRVEAVKNTLYLGNLSWALTGVLNLTSMALIYYLGLKYMYPIVTLGTIIAIDSYSSRFWEPIEYLSMSYNDLMDASTYLERIFELLDEPLLIENSANALKPHIKGNIEFENVYFSYDNQVPVLKNLNLKIKAGEKIGLVGVTGSGKSTILSLISRFYDTNKGTILIDNYDIKTIDLKTLRKSISMMMQDSYLFARSVYDNLVLGQNISLKKVREICKLLDIDDMIMSLEKGYDTILLNNGSNLSSGERQLLCIARIMIQNPQILILDEATSNIDLKTEKKIVNALNIVTQNRTTIMVAHRISTIKNCDKIILIKNHRNYEEGTHEELMAKKGAYYKLYMSQNIN